MTGNLLVRNVRPWGRSAIDMRVVAGHIEAVGHDLSDRGFSVEDGGGRIAIPGLVDAHTHLDKSLVGMDWYRNDVGPRLIDRIENERAQKTALGIDPVRQSRRQALLSLAQGTTHIRSHVDVDTVQGLVGIEGVLRTKHELRDVVDIQLVAFPQSGLLSRPGTLDLMKSAMKMGADLVGGLDPSGLDRDPKGHLDAVFGLAQQFGRSIDIHLHEPGELGAFSLDLIIERTRALGMQGKVAVSHAFCLGMLDADRTAMLIDQLAEQSIRIVTAAVISAPTPPVKRLHDAGVIIGVGNDGVRDTWGPYGSGDMIERAMLLGLRNNFRRDDDVALALSLATKGGADVMGVSNYGLDVGCKADICLLDGATIAEAVVDHRPRPIVIKGGIVVARNGHLSPPFN